MSDREQLTYLRNNDLRAEIVRAVGGDPSRYETGGASCGLCKADLVRIAETVTSHDEPSELTLRELYDTLDAAVPGMDHSHNAGNTWGIERKDLKALHRAVHDESQLVTDGGSDVCSDGTERKVCLDLFSGLGGFSAAFEDAPGWDVVTVDIKERFDPDIQADVLGLMPSDLLDVLGDVDVLVILAGHPCTLFSLAGNHDAWDFQSREPLTPEASDAIASVYHTLGLIKGLCPDYWVLENPRGRLRWFLGEPTDTVTYCQYGEDWQKPTDLWGEHPPGLTYRSCSPGDPCHERTPQDDDDSGCLANSMRDPAKRAKIPYDLSKEILDAVEGRAEQATLIRFDGGRNARSVDTGADRSTEAPR